MAVMSTVVQEGASMGKPSVHIHQGVDQFVDVWVSVLLNTQAIACQLKAIVADLQANEISKARFIRLKLN